MPKATPSPVRRSVRLVSKSGVIDVVDAATDAFVPGVQQIELRFTAGDPVHEVMLRFTDGTAEIVDCDLVVCGV